MPNRQIINGEPYRYAYQGQEKDPETGKEAFQLRLWDARIGRWLTTDPAKQFSSPYLGMGNNPIKLIDPDGGSTDCPDCPWYQKLFSYFFDFGKTKDEFTNSIGTTGYTQEELEARNKDRLMSGITGFNEMLTPDGGEFNIQATFPLAPPGGIVPYQNLTVGSSFYIDSFGNIGYNFNYGVEIDPIPSFDIGFDVSVIYAVEPHKKLHLTNFAGDENNYDLTLPTPYATDLTLGYFNSVDGVYRGGSLGLSWGVSRYSRSLPNGYFSYSRTTGSDPNLLR